jgi:hypothetical protein
MTSGGWTTFLFGSGTWTMWYGSLCLAFLMLMGTAYYACQDPSGPSATPMLMLMVFFVAFVIMAIGTTIDVALWAGTAGYGPGVTIVFVAAAWVALGLLWTFLFWASDPNYPDRLLPGRLLFTLHSMLIYAGNLWILWQLRAASPAGDIS